MKEIQRIMKEKHPDRTNRHYEILLNNLDKIPKGAKILEIGAGMKAIKKMLPKDVDYCTLDIGEKYDYVFNLDDGRMPIQDNLFDVIICMMTLEHVMYPEKVILEMKRIAKPDALFFLCLPNDYNFLQRIYYLLGKKVDDDNPFCTVSEHLHIHKPRIEDIEALFNKHFQIEASEYFWQSRKSMTNILAYCVDSLLHNTLAIAWPTMFARGMSIMGRKK
jgi:SAM-dependent methyltransferase